MDGILSFFQKIDTETLRSISVGFADFILIFFLLYGVLYFLRGTRSANVLFGVIAILLVLTFVSNALDLVVLRYVFDTIVQNIALAILIIFQPEFRRTFAQVGSIFVTTKTSRETIDQVVDAVKHLSLTRTGALIVFERNIGLTDIVKSAVSLSSRVDSALLQSIFFPNSPLHDCAVIIKNDKIIAAHAVLPLAEESFFSEGKRLGTRHRASVGITQETDAVVVTVSEETGVVSVSVNGRISRGYTCEDLREELSVQLLHSSKKQDGKLFHFAVDRKRTKGGSK